MSKSRSPTPTRNLSTSNIVTSPRPTASRIQLLDEHAPAPSDSLSGARLHEPLIVHLPSPPPLASSSRFLESGSTRRSSHLIRPAEASPEEPMAKRMRRDSPAARGRPDNHSSPSSDSQDDMADSEMDVNKSSNPEPQPPAAPPKKKRTRTLTTPHQSAVLHALLAQSRFPTTAMREEVGRSIGLSARKVQIWFQNQRQKARRPRSQGEPPSSRPPQYGPFPGGPESTGRGFEEHRLEHMPYPGQPLPELQAGTGDIPGRLLGPGMPGAIPYSPQAYRHAHPPPPPLSAPSGETRFPMGQPFQRVPSPHAFRSPRMYPQPTARPATSQPSSWRERERDPSRTLPPLVSTRPVSSTYGTRGFSSGSSQAYLPTRASFVSPRSTSPEPRFAHQPPEPTPRPSLHLPPPFTLQPSPQWDESSYSALPRPSSSAWSRPGSRSTRGRSTSPIAARREPIGGTAELSDAFYLAERTPHLHSPSPRPMPPSETPSSRSGRYDPIRATFIPFSTPSVSPTISPVRPSGEGDEQPDQNISPSHEDR